MTYFLSLLGRIFEISGIVLVIKGFEEDISWLLILPGLLIFSSGRSCERIALRKDMLKIMEE